MQSKLFHPAVDQWLTQTFPTPSQCQQKSWPRIQQGKNTLIAAPTGSGKTLAAFLAVIDSLIKQGQKGVLPDQTFVVYISPLKALSNDIQKNLEQPLEGIREALFELCCPDVFINTQVRTGDTPAAARAAMLKRPPHILVTTPESIYLLLTSEGGRKMLKSVHTVIVDEIHAVVGSKRGSHLSLSLERLQQLVATPLLRIGLSATQHPIEEVARFLTGGQSQPCEIVDGGHSRQMDLAIEVPRNAPLETLLSADASKDLHDRLAELIEQHSTTLIFVNTRRMAERTARFLSERIGEENITSHHGSLAREQRFDAENRLKTGQLKALVATASLELGIDIGDVDLVCQIGTTGSIATLLQRVGRSGHYAGGLPKGRLFPTSRDELIENLALIDAVRRGELDILHIPPWPIDVLAQQITAMVCCEEWDEEALFNTVTRAYPYQQLPREKYDQLLDMLADGYTTSRGKRGAHLYRDRINKRLRARRGARLTAITCGGAIPDNADYRVIVEPTEEFIGTVDEDFAIESLAGDIFQLGNSSWRVLRVEQGNLRVLDAENQPPSIPFWFGEAPGRSWEASMAVSRLRTEIAILCDPSDASATISAQNWLQETLGASPEVARQATNYIAAAQTTLGCIPDINTLVLERFFDESGGMQLILHAPFGSCVNRGWGLALRKRFCRSFNFELQAAATENAVILSLGTSQSFSLPEVARYLNSNTVRNILIQAMLDAPMFTIRWRWNATISLAVKRFQSGKKTPPHLVRMQAEDLVTSAFPDQLACLENISGDREIPDHPLVYQTIEDCLTEAMDIERLTWLIQRIESGEMKVEARDVVEPSPFAAEILTARNYAFLDGAPAEERRTRAVMSRRWLDPTEARDLGSLDQNIIQELSDEAWPQAQTADELHDGLMTAGFIRVPQEIRPGWQSLFDELVQQKRATRVKWNQGDQWWICAERLPLIRIREDAEFNENPPVKLPDSINQPADSPEAALLELVRARTSCRGPATGSEIARDLLTEASTIEPVLIQLETEGVLLRGSFTPAPNETEWCDRRLLARIHQRTLQGLRRKVAPVSTAAFIRFLTHWQHLHPAKRLKSADALPAIVEQLQGFEAPASSWEETLLPSRLEHYQPEWLDQHCQSGKLLWNRLSKVKNSTSTARNTPISLLLRRHRALWLTREDTDSADQSLSGAAGRVMEILHNQGALFYDELLTQSRMLKSQLETAMAELVGYGLLSCDSFIGLRVLMTPDIEKRNRLRNRWEMDDAGRWSLLTRSSNNDPQQNTEALEHIAWNLLKRYGVMFRALLQRESLAPAWHQLLPIYRRLEARGEIRGGRFVQAQYGEQFALPEAVETLRQNQEPDSEEHLIAISGVDPLNLAGIVLPGDKVPALSGNRLVLLQGEVIAHQISGKVELLKPVSTAMEWEIRHLLKQQLRRNQSRGKRQSLRRSL